VRTWHEAANRTAAPVVQARMRVTFVVMAAAWSAIAAAAQTPGPPPPDAVFEAASIKLNRTGGDTAGLRRFPGGRFEVTNMPLSFIINFAYQLQSFELQGGPSWIESDRWDIIAKSVGDPPPTAPGTPDAMALATRTLLAERFKLAVRQETREVDVYQLVRANADGRLGPGIQPSTVDCLAIQKAGDAAAKGGPPAPNPNTPDRVVCGLRVGIGRIQAGGRSIPALLNVLTSISQRRVVDRTGLTGEWQFDITFTPPAPPARCQRAAAAESRRRLTVHGAPGAARPQAGSRADADAGDGGRPRREGRPSY
jgi:uncharacterized protein (TIGR03435 family)